MVAELMPIHSEAPRCSEFANSIDLRPPGSGLFLDRVILVSVPTPWPKPALKHDWLFTASQFVNASTVPTRLFAAEPTNGAQQTKGVRVEAFERSAEGSRLATWVVADPSEIGPLVETIVATPMDQLEGQAAVRRPTFLVCTQGSHDVCCGEAGVDFADELERERPDYDVRRVSHTGGHRFAPTLLALPDGRMWAFADLALADRIAERTETADDFRLKSRGWWGAKVGPAQVAETAVQVAIAEQATHARRLDPIRIKSQTNHERSGAADDAHSFVAEFNAQAWSIDVTVGRVVPSIACQSPGGLPAKPGREFTWVISELKT